MLWIDRGSDSTMGVRRAEIMVVVVDAKGIVRFAGCSTFSPVSKQFGQRAKVWSGWYLRGCIPLREVSETVEYVSQVPFLILGDHTVRKRIQISSCSLQC